MNRNKSRLAFTKETGGVVPGEGEKITPLSNADLKQTMVPFSSLDEASMQSVLLTVMTLPEARRSLIEGKSYTMYVESEDGKIQIYGITMKQPYEERF